MRLRPEVVVVTGGAGFIGSAFVRHLVLHVGIQVVNLDKLTYAGNLESLAPVADNPKYIFEQVDICDGHEVGRVLERYTPHAIVNLAAESHVDRSIEGPTAFIQTNIIGTYRLLEAVHTYWNKLGTEMKGRFRLHHVSTDEVYGSLGRDGLFREQSPYRPNSPYAASKAAADHLVRAWHRTYGIPTLITNSCNNYGPYQFPEKLIPLMILCALDGDQLPVYGKGNHVRDWLYVDDHVRALWLVLTQGTPGEVYNIGGSQERTNLEVVRAICTILDELAPSRLRQMGMSHYEELIASVEDRPGHDKRYAIDASKVQKTTGWAPEETFESGLRRTVEWYMSNMEWCKRVQDGSYARERLGLLS